MSLLKPELLNEIRPDLAVYKHSDFTDPIKEDVYESEYYVKRFLKSESNRAFSVFKVKEWAKEGFYSRLIQDVFLGQVIKNLMLEGYPSFVDHLTLSFGLKQANIYMLKILHNTADMEEVIGEVPILGLALDRKYLTYHSQFGEVSGFDIALKLSLESFAVLKFRYRPMLTDDQSKQIDTYIKTLQKLIIMRNHKIDFYTCNL